MRSTILAACLTALVVLAGCVDGAKEAQEATGPPAPEDGGLRGTVVDEAITPLPAATIRIQGTDLATSSDHEGGFVFADLEPGMVTLEVTKAGWVSAQTSVRILADEDPEPVRVILKAVPRQEPRAQTLQDVGFIACSWGTPLVYDSCADELGQEDDPRLQFLLEGVPTMIQVEVVWQSQQALSDNLYMINAVCPPADHDRCPGGTPTPSVAPYRWGEGSYTSPAIMRTPAGHLADALAYHHVPSMDGWSVGVDVSADGPALATGAAVDQEFRGYVTIFWNIDPDPDWTFTRDGAYPA